MDVLEGDRRPISVENPFSIRRLERQDVAALATLWAEMQCHYGRPVTDAAATAAASTACNAQRDEGFTPRILVAVAADGSFGGSIVLNVSFPAYELSRSLYIRDLYVAAAMRRRGVALAMLKAAASLAVAQGFSAIDWTTEADNLNARRLYSGAGARQLPRVYYRLDGADMQRIVSRDHCLLIPVDAGDSVSLRR